MSVASQLQERRANVFEGMKVLADDAAAENRNFTGEEQTTWERQNAELRSLDDRIKAIVEGEERAKSAQESFDRINGQRQEVRTSEDSTLVSEMRSWLTKANPADYLDVRAPGRLDTAINEARALSKGTNAAGGFTIKTGFNATLVQHLINNSALLNAGASVIQTASGEPLAIPKTTSHPTAVLVPEAGVIPTSEPVLAQITLGAYKFADLMSASYELLNDTSVDLEGYLAEAAGRALGNALGGYLISGTGTSQPRGLLTDTTLGVTSGTTVAGVPTADNLIDLHYAVIQAYRNQSSAAWLMNDSTVATVRKFKDSTGQYLWQPSLIVGAPDTFLGKPVYTDPGMPATGLSAKSVVFGDLSKYQVRLAGGVRFERSVDYAFNTDMVTFRAIIRGDGALVDTSGAVKHFVGAAS